MYARRLRISRVSGIAHYVIISQAQMPDAHVRCVGKSQAAIANTETRRLHTAPVPHYQLHVTPPHAGRHTPEHPSTRHHSHHIHHTTHDPPRVRIDTGY
jgi:hypothetical protein